MSSAQVTHSSSIFVYSPQLILVLTYHLHYTPTSISVIANFYTSTSYSSIFFLFKNFFTTVTHYSFILLLISQKLLHYSNSLFLHILFIQKLLHYSSLLFLHILFQSFYSFTSLFFFVPQPCLCITSLSPTLLSPPILNPIMKNAAFLKVMEESVAPNQPECSTPQHLLRSAESDRAPQGSVLE